MVSDATGVDVVPDDTIANFLEELRAPSSNESAVSVDETVEQAEIATVFNLTCSPIETDVAELLQKGLKFVPTPNYLEGEETELKADLDHLASKLRGKCNNMTMPDSLMSRQPHKDRFVKSSAVKPSKATKISQWPLLANRLHKLSLKSQLNIPQIWTKNCMKRLNGSNRMRIT